MPETDAKNGNGHGNGHHKMLMWILAGVGAGLVAIGSFGANLISRSMDLQERSIQVTAEFRTALDANTSAVKENKEQNAKANEWLKLLAESQKEGFWRFFRYSDPEGMKLEPML